jgi:hypothetical protein
MRRDFEEKFDLIVDANDSILERVVRAILSTIFTAVFKIMGVNSFSSFLVF